MPEQNLTQLRAVGTSIIDGVKAAKDGIQIGDIMVGQRIAGAIIAAVDDIKVDEPSAIEEIAGQLLREAAAMRRASKGITAIED